VNDRRYYCTIHVRERKKAVLITGNDAITSDNNKNEGSGD